MTAPLEFMCRDQVVNALRLAGLHGPAQVVLAGDTLPFGFPRNTREHDARILNPVNDASVEIMLLTGQCSPDDHRIWQRADVAAWIKDRTKEH